MPASARRVNDYLPADSNVYLSITTLFTPQISFWLRSFSIKDWCKPNGVHKLLSRSRDGMANKFPLYRNKKKKKCKKSMNVRFDTSTGTTHTFSADSIQCTHSCKMHLFQFFNFVQYFIYYYLFFLRICRTHSHATRTHSEWLFTSTHTHTEFLAIFSLLLCCFSLFWNTLFLKYLLSNRARRKRRECTIFPAEVYSIRISYFAQSTE